MIYNCAVHIVKTYNLEIEADSDAAAQRILQSMSAEQVEDEGTLKTTEKDETHIFGTL